MASFKAKFPVLQELFAKNHRGGPLGPPSGARVNLNCRCFGRTFFVLSSSTHSTDIGTCSPFSIVLTVSTFLSGDFFLN